MRDVLLLLLLSLMAHTFTRSGAHSHKLPGSILTNSRRFVSQLSPKLTNEANPRVRLLELTDFLADSRSVDQRSLSSNLFVLPGARRRTTNRCLTWALQLPLGISTDIVAPLRQRDTRETHLEIWSKRASRRTRANKTGSKSATLRN